VIFLDFVHKKKKIQEIFSGFSSASIYDIFPDINLCL
jgi:hypothetical protein